MDYNFYLPASAIFLLLLIFSINSVNAQQNQFKVPEETKQFDFWIGIWDAEWQSLDGKTQKGTNRIEHILDNGIVSENFDGRPGNTLIGKSWSIFNQNSKMWQQTWVDNQGGYLVLSGEFKDGRMVLTTPFRTNSNGQQVAQRMIFFNITEKSFDWEWQNTIDNGETWNIGWKIKYTRKK